MLSFEAVHVPVVSTLRPREFAFEQSVDGREEVEEGQGQDDVVIDRHDER